MSEGNKELSFGKGGEGKEEGEGEAGCSLVGMWVGWNGYQKVKTLT